MFRRDRFGVRLPALLRGEETASSSSGRLPRLATDEDGMISLAAVLAVLFFLVLLAMVGNIGQAINRKIEVQNTADATATSAALQMARGLNAVTAANHLLGELLSLVVLHEAIGGKTPKSGQPRDTQQLDNDLQNRKQNPMMTGHDDVQKLANYPGASTIAYSDVIKPVLSDNMLLDSYRDLKTNLTTVYQVKTLALVLYSLKDAPLVGGILGAAGTAIYELGDLCDEYIDIEWNVLAYLEDFASRTAGFRDALFKLLPAIRPFTLLVRDTMPSLAAQTGKAIGQKSGATTTIYPALPIMPLADDPTPPSASDPVFAHSQLVRATYPWVAYQRQSLMSFMGWMVFSNARKHYREWTDKVTLSKSRELYASGGAPLLMLTGSAPERKTRESWVRDSRQADQLFTLMGFAHQPSTVGWGPSFFPKTNPDGIATFSQAIVYNANSNTGRADPDHQPDAGWDTLNWQSGPGSSSAVEHPGATRPPSGSPPRIHLNWQVKLIPVSRLAEARDRLPAPFREPLRRIDPNSPSAHTH